MVWNYKGQKNGKTEVWHNTSDVQRSFYLFNKLLFSAYGFKGLPWWLSGKEFTCRAGDVGSIPGSARSPGRGHGYPLQYSCLGNPMDGGAWRATVHRVTVRPDLVTKQQQQIHIKHNWGVEVLAMKNRYILKVCSCVCFVCFFSFFQVVIVGMNLSL